MGPRSWTASRSTAQGSTLHRQHVSCTLGCRTLGGRHVSDRPGGRTADAPRSDSWNQRPADLPEPDDGNGSRVARVQVRSEMAPDPSIRPDARAPDDSRVCGWWCREGSRIGSGTCTATSHSHVRDLVSARRFSTPLSCGPSRQSFLKRRSANRPVSESTFSESHKRLGDELFGFARIVRRVDVGGDQWSDAVNLHDTLCVRRSHSVSRLRQKRRTCTLKTSGCSMLLRCPASEMIASSAPGMAACSCSATCTGLRRSMSPHSNSVGT